MSLYARGEPARIAQERATTERQKTMAGVCLHPARKRCVCCKTMRTEATGRETQAGFVCHCCTKRGLA